MEADFGGLATVKARIFVSFFVGALSLSIVSCNEVAGRWSSSQDPFSSLSLQEASVKMNYAYVKSNILDKYCTSCHGNDGGVNLQSIEGVRAHSQSILIDMKNKTMPKGAGASTMTTGERQILYFWVKAGAPQGTAVVAPDVPAYPPLSSADAAVKLNYAYVQGKILIPYCMVCHGTAGDISVESLDQIRANSSKIMHAVAVDRSMPLGNLGKKITEDDRSVLYNWLLQGAPEGTDPAPSPFNINYPPLSSDDQQKLNYPYIRDNILIPKCVSCHGTSGHISLDNLASVQKSTKRIIYSVFSVAPTMPPFGVLKPGWNPVTQPTPDPLPAHRAFTDSELHIFYAWLTAGAPAGTLVDPPPIRPTYEDINQRIFQVRCMDCHDPSSKLGKNHPLTKEGLLNPQDDAVKPGHPETSSLFLSLEQKGTDPDTDPAPMPPAKKGYAPLKPEELQAVKDWILNGAKD
jgi:cytochrome c553